MSSLFHPIQISILNYLTYHPQARFSDLNTTKITTDHFNFHVKSLLNDSLIEKNTDGKYSLTQNGKQLIVSLEKESMFQQYKIVTVIICESKINGTTKYLLEKRQKEPFFGIYDFLAGKVHWSETTTAAARRMLKAKTGIVTNVTFQKIQHKIDKDENNIILENIFMYVYSAIISNKNFAEVNGQNLYWMSKDEIKKLEPRFPDMINLLSKTKNKYSEQSFLIHNY
jgi:predicted transcriptional regulator